MADEIPYQVLAAPLSGGRSLLVVWRGLKGGDVGQPYHSAHGIKTVEMVGDFGGAVALEGSISGAVWTVLHDGLGVPILRSAAALSAVAQQPYQVRPVAGAGVRAVDVWLLVPTGV